MNLQYLLNYEQELIKKEICAKYCTNTCTISNNTINDVEIQINEDLQNVENGTAIITHTNLINSLIYKYLETKQIPTSYFDIGDILEIPETNIKDIPTLCEGLHIAFLNSQFEYKNGKIIRNKSKRNLIEKGAVYTKTNTVHEIVENTLANSKSNNSDFQGFTILDFACGTGRFYENIVEILSDKYSISPEDAVLKHIYAIDIDPIAVNITRLKAINHLAKITEEKVQTILSHIIHRNALIRDDIFSTNPLFLKHTDLDGFINGKFDAIVSNPPYLVLKLNKNKLGETHSSKIQKQVSYFRNSGNYQYSIEGMLNYYQLSIETMLTMLKPNGEMGVICPSSLFADISATKLRKHLLQKHKLRKIKYFSEKEQLFENVTQATNIFYLQKFGKTDIIEIEENENSFSVDIELVKQLFPEKNEIPFIAEKEWTILAKLSKQKKLKELENVRNRRGELDLTLYKNFITNQKTPYRLVRGNMISEQEIKDINGEFVAENFLHEKAEEFLKNDFKRKRLICQQISNSGLKKRLKFVFCKECDILANSCNYLSSDEITLKKLNLLLNSSILNWRFKITSSNNHINNYELNELPIVDLDKIDEHFSFTTQKELDEYVGQLYNLTTEEINFILQK